MQIQADCKSRLEQYFREHKVEYTLEHHPLAYTARAVAASEHVAPARVAKTVVVVADTEPALVVLPASENVDVPSLTGALGAKHVRFADEAELGPLFPDCEVGAMPPFGNLYGLRVYVDTALEEFETIRFEAGTYTDTMCIKYADFRRLVQPIGVHVGRPREALTVLV